MARELWPQGIHVAHVVIDGIIGDADSKSPIDDSNHEPEMHPDAIAEAYWQLILQDCSAWTLELDLRPNREKFFEELRTDAPMAHPTPVKTARIPSSGRGFMPLPTEP